MTRRTPRPAWRKRAPCSRSSASTRSRRPGRQVMPAAPARSRGRAGRARPQAAGGGAGAGRLCFGGLHQGHPGGLRCSRRGHGGGHPMGTGAMNWRSESMSKGGQDGRAAGGGGYSKRGKPRPGTGGFRRDKLEGKGPTPPAYMRPGHPAQRAAAKAARGAGRPGQGSGEASGTQSAAAVRNHRKRTRQHGAAARGRKWSRAVTPSWSHCARGFPRWPCTSRAGRRRTSGSRSPCSWRRRRGSRYLRRGRPSLTG